jgi:HD-GYP domain-containing protein (c-di-GMP phosphodiesterase class II)
MVDSEYYSQAKDFIRYLKGALRNKRIYPSGHPLVQILIDDLFGSLNFLTKGQKTLTMLFTLGKIVIGGISPSLISIPSDESFIDEIRSLEVEKITFKPGIRRNDLLMLIDILTGCEKMDAVPRIKLERLKIEEKEYVKNIKEAKVLYLKSLSSIKGVFREFKEKGTLDSMAMSEISRVIVRSMVKHPDFLPAIASLKFHEEYTYTHSLNVAVWTTIQAQSLNIKKSALEEYCISALAHDIGKTIIPIEILSKPSKLTDEEFELVRRHPFEGAKMLRRIPGLPGLTPLVAFEHHMGYDLSGYPKVQYKRKLHLCSLMCTISDVYDALTTKRPYKVGFSPEMAMTVLKTGRGKQFHPFLLDRFCGVVGLYPRGTVVLLNTGEVAVVYETNIENSLRPVVKVVMESGGKSLSSIPIINLNRDEFKEKYHIVRSLKPDSISIDPIEFLDKSKLLTR